MLSYFGQDPTQQAICTSSVDTFYNVTWTGHAQSTFSFPMVAQMSAFVGRADAAYGNVTAMLYRFGTITPNAMDNEGDNAPAPRQVLNNSPEATAAAADVLHSLLLQSYRGVIRLFPAVPARFEGNAVFHRLRAERGFLVTSRMTAGAVCFVQLESLKGAQPVMLSVPWALPSGAASVVTETQPSGPATVSVAVLPPEAGSSSVRLEVTGLQRGHTLLLYPRSSSRACGARAAFGVGPLPAVPGQENFWGYHAGGQWPTPNSTQPGEGRGEAL